MIVIADVADGYAAIARDQLAREVFHVYVRHYQCYSAVQAAIKVFGRDDAVNAAVAAVVGSGGSNGVDLFDVPQSAGTIHAGPRL